MNFPCGYFAETPVCLHACCMIWYTVYVYTSRCALSSIWSEARSAKPWINGNKTIICKSFLLNGFSYWTAMIMITQRDINILLSSGWFCVFCHVCSFLMEYFTITLLKHYTPEIMLIKNVKYYLAPVTAKDHETPSSVVFLNLWFNAFWGEWKVLH